MSPPHPPAHSPTHPNTHTEATYLTPTHVLEHLYCPRFTYFEHVLLIPEHQEKRLKVQKGREVHEERQQVNPGYLRKKLGVLKREFEVPLASMALGVKGIVDEVLWLDDETMAPFDYKFAEDPGQVYENLRVQSVLYGLLIRENYGKPVTRGYLCYTRSNYRVKEIPFDEKDFEHALGIVTETMAVIRTGVFPEATKWTARCPDCCYRNICVR
jgi:CRISPR-associated exonuclease Cas4